MKIALVAGESSGDVLGAGLIRALGQLFPQAEFEGVCGPEMLAAGCVQIEPAESLAVMGLIEPLAHIPRLLKLRRSLVRRWKASPPDVFIGIDAPDFNLSLEKQLRAADIKTVHYVSPSIWAWRAGRIKTIRAAADRVLCILPFEKAIYDDAGIDAVFVGHPKADSAPARIDSTAARVSIGLAATNQVVALLPGSRKGEITRLGPILMASARQLLQTHAALRFVTPIATAALRPLIEAQIDAEGLGEYFTLLDGDSELAMKSADVVLLASGTAVLESALLGRPTVAAYKVNELTYTIAVRMGMVKLSHYTLPNLLTEQPLVPEFMQGNARPELIAAAVAKLLDDPERRQAISARFAKLRDELAQDTDQRAAGAVAEILQN